MKKILILLLSITALGFCSKDHTCHVSSTKDTVSVFCFLDSKLGLEIHKLKMSKDGSYFEWNADWGDGDRSLEVYTENGRDIRYLHIHIDKYGVESRRTLYRYRRPIEAWNSAKSVLGF